MTRHDDHTAQQDVTTLATQGIVRFLQEHEQLSQMEVAHQQFLAEQCTRRTFVAGESLLSPESGQVKQWYLLFDGKVEGTQQVASATQPEVRFYLTPGDGFPVAALFDERPTRTHYVAATQCECLVVDLKPFSTLIQVSDVFRTYIYQNLSPLLGRLQRQIQVRATRALGSDQTLDTPLQQLVVRTPTTCTPSTPLGLAVQKMHDRQVSSIAILGQNDQLEGIFTLRDLRRVFSDEDTTRAQPIALFMTKAPYVLHAQDTAYDAAMLMTRHHIGHICVVENGQLLGVLSERDLFSLQRIDLVRLSRALRHADSVETLQTLRSNMTRLVSNMLAHGAQASQITALVTQLNDHTTTRVIELMLSKHPAITTEFCWLSFGSEGRNEQTLLTDQDNGILFYPKHPDETETCRQQLLALAQDVNVTLDQCGLTLCPGNIMASNPALCLSLSEWRQKFAEIIQTPDPDNLLSASIYFDVRSIWGPAWGLDELKPYLLGLVNDHPQFQRMMAENALKYRLPVQSVFNRIGHVLGLTEQTINLKTQALSAFVDAIRVLALAYGIHHASTCKRLDRLGIQGAIPVGEAKALQDAYLYLQLLRLQLHLQQSENKQALSNVLRPDSLNALERRILQEAIRQAQRLQDVLRFKYQL